MVLLREKRYTQGFLHHFLLVLEGQVALETRPFYKLKASSARLNYSLVRNISTKNTFDIDMVLFQSILLSIVKV